MKIIRTLLIVIAVIIVALAGVSAFLPSSVHVERDILINASTKTVFDQINILKNWKKWSYWDNIDPNMVSTYEGPEAGTGAIHKWSSKNDSVGNGSLTITQSTPPSEIVYSLNLENMGTNSGGWLVDETDDGTKVTTYMDIELPFYGRIFPGLVLEKWLSKDFEKTLSNLKAYSETLPKDTTPKWTVDAVTIPATPVLEFKASCNAQTIVPTLDSAYEKIIAIMTKQGISKSGNRYSIYYKYTPDSVDLAAGIQVDKLGTPENGVTSRELGGNALKIDYYGPYEGIGQAYNFMNKWLKDNQKIATGAPWEEYITDPTVEKDSTKFLTRIYYPVN